MKSSSPLTETLVSTLSVMFSSVFGITVVFCRAASEVGVALEELVASDVTCKLAVELEASKVVAVIEDSFASVVDCELSVVFTTAASGVGVSVNKWFSVDIEVVVVGVVILVDIIVDIFDSVVTALPIVVVGTSSWKFSVVVEVVEDRLEDDSAVKVVSDDSFYKN